MRVELLTIGSELLSGATVNTNAAFLARRLAELGLPCGRQTAVRDRQPEVVAALREAVGRADLLILTGGLGPTFDDVTVSAIAQALGRPLVSRSDVVAQIRRFYARRHRRLRRVALRQACLPEGAQPLWNALGTAPGVWLRCRSDDAGHPASSPCTVVALPGVPREMQAMFDRNVVARLRRLPGRTAMASVTIRTIGVVELHIQHLLRRLRIPAGLEIGLYPDLQAVDVRFTAVAPTATAARRRVARAARQLERALGSAVYGRGGRRLEEAVGECLARRRLRIAVAESCTGGLIASRLTDVPGSSRYVRGALVAYHNEIKQVSLGVPAALLARYGAVSAPVARAMARGIRRLAGSDIGLSVTGIAGPSGGSAAKPVGVVYLALAHGGRVRVRRYRFVGNRAAINAQAAQLALDWVRCEALSPRRLATGRRSGRGSGGRRN